MSGARVLGGQEGGFTLIEVIITMFITVLVVGSMAILFANGNHSSLASQRQVQMLSAAQRQIESIRQSVDKAGFSALAMTSLPTKAGPDTDPSNPTDFITATGLNYEIEENYDTPGTLATGTPSSGEAMIVSKEGVVTPIQTAVVIAPSGNSSSAVTGTVYTFVTHVTDVCNGTLPNNGGTLCTASAGATTALDGDVRRVTVAIKLDKVGGTQNNGPNQPQYLTTLITNPHPSNEPSATNSFAYEEELNAK